MNLRMRIYRIKCGFYSRAATISLIGPSMQRLFEGGYYSKCGVYSRKYGAYMSLSYSYQLLTSVLLYRLLETTMYVKTNALVNEYGNLLKPNIHNYYAENIMYSTLMVTYLYYTA